ncbi:MAG: hypothetical protein FWD68_02745 [Alphaproteobacteria bacterium]|nr:hypothetical protein [Alphaproteobacteria bacterium]
MSAWRTTMMQTASRLRIHGALTAAAAIAILATVVIIRSAPAALEFRLTVLACAILMLGQGVQLLFDAALFRLGLASDSEEAALLVIDRTLDAMGLRHIPAEPPALLARIAGTRRLLRRQYLVLGTTVAILAFSLLERTGT